MPDSGPCAPCFSREKVEDGTPPAVVTPKSTDEPKAAKNGDATAKVPADEEAGGGSSLHTRIVSLLRGNTNLEEPLLKKEPEKPVDIVCAAWVIEDALDGHCADEYPEGEEGKALRHRANRLFRLKKLVFYVLVFLSLMMFFEVPLWCTPVDSSNATTWSAKDYCPSPVQDKFYKDVMFVQVVIPPKYGMLLEVVCYSVLTFIFLFEYKLSRSLGEKRRLANCMPERFLIILGLMWLDLGYYYFQWEKGFFAPFRFAPYGRLALLFSGARVRWVFSSTWQCLDEFGSVCLFLMGCIVLFAWMLFNIFDDLSDAAVKKGADPADVTPAILAGDEEGKYFKSFGTTFVTLFTVMTGAAFPDEVTCAMKQSHWYALIFYPFMGLTFFLFTQLMLAVVYNAYSGETEERLKAFYVTRSKALAKSFSMLAVENGEGSKVIKTDTFSSLVAVLSTWPRFKGRLREQDSQVLFEALDDDGTGELSMNEFFDACSILQYTIWSTSEKSIFWKLKVPGLNAIEKFISSGLLQHCTEVVLVANALFIIVQSVYDFGNTPEPDVFPYIEFFFSVIYMVEVVLKLLVTSFQHYWHLTSNRFDFFVSWVLFVGGTIAFFDVSSSFGDFSFDDLMQYFNILRVLRVLRLCTQVPRLKKMMICIGKFGKVSGDMVILFFISTAALAVVGVQVFGGLLYPGSTNAEGDFANAGFDVLGFNDMTGAFLALMDMMVTAYQPEYAMAMDEVLPIETPFVRIECIGEIYCMAVFFLSVNIAFNIFTAFLIDIFVSLEETEEEGEETEEQKNLVSMKSKYKEMGQVLHFLEPPEVLRLRTLTGVIDGLDEAIQEAQDEALGESSAKGDEDGGDDAAGDSGDSLEDLAKDTLGSFREGEYISKLVEKLKKESIMKPSDMLAVSKEAMEEKLQSQGEFQFVELADAIRIREAAEAKTAAEK